MLTTWCHRRNTGGHTLLFSFIASQLHSTLINIEGRNLKYILFLGGSRGKGAHHGCPPPFTPVWKDNINNCTWMGRVRISLLGMKKKGWISAVHHCSYLIGDLWLPFGRHGLKPLLLTQMWRWTRDKCSGDFDAVVPSTPIEFHLQKLVFLRYTPCKCVCTSVQLHCVLLKTESLMCSSGQSWKTRLERLSKKVFFCAVSLKI